MRTLLLLPLTLFLLTTVAAAQIPTKGNVFLGYSYARFGLTPPPPLPDTAALTIAAANANGWNGSLEGRVFPHVGIVADISGHYGTWDFTQRCGFVPVCTLPPQGRLKASIYEVVFGPRISVSVRKFTPFGQALFGVSRLSGDQRLLNFGKTQTAFAHSLGGGVDYRLVRSIAWRVQADWLQNRFFERTHSNLRLSIGPVLRF